MRVYLRQANKRRVRSTPFHHVDGPLFSFMMWNSTLISDGFLLLPYKCCHLKFFFICVRLFIIVPCFLHLSIFLVFIIDLPISPHRLFSLVTSDQIFFYTLSLSPANAAHLTLIVVKMCSILLGSAWLASKVLLLQ